MLHIYYADVWRSNRGSGSSHVIISWQLAYVVLFENGRMTQIGECQQVDRSKQMEQRVWKHAYSYQRLDAGHIE